jgi:ABC-type lipoprotein export system ATPase subunit
MGKAIVRVLRGASLHAERGEFLVVMGASGSGKSTLLHLLGALDSPDKGKVEFCDRDLFLDGAAARSRYRNHEVGFVFQFYHLLPELSVLGNVALPRLVTHGAIQWFSARREAREEAKAIIERVGLTERIRHRPNELSGGELQRVAIARALINKPSLLLADEPTGNLDATSGKEILELLEELNRGGQTIIMVTHDAQVAARAHRRVRLEEGRIRTK